MKAEDTFNNDPIRKYIDPGKIEKAPDGFSTKLMSLIYLETSIARKEKKNSVPFISWIVITILTGAAFLLPGNSLSFQFFEIPSDLMFKLPELKTGFEVPEVILPLLSGILLLVLLDLLLKGLFNKRKYQD